MATLPEALNLAQQALNAGNRAQAAHIYRQILEAVPEEPNALNGLGLLALGDNRLDEAENLIGRAIAGYAGDASFHNNLNLVYRQQGRPQEAVACCRQALELNPELPELHNNLGIALKEAGELDAAVASFEHAVRNRPSYADAHYNLANALTKLHRLSEAEIAYRRAIELAPTDFEPHNNLGTLLELQGRYPEAMACYQRAMQCKADATEVHRNLAMMRLRAGDYLAAWEDYEWRWRWSMPQFAVPKFPEPPWKGEPLENRTILLRAEQGIGDIIQFIRFAAVVKQRGGRVLFESAPKLHALLGTATGLDRIVPDDGEPEPLDFAISLLSLPAMFGTTLDTIPATGPYLFAETERVERWRQELAGIDEFKVGIAWQGNPHYTGDYYRSIPLEQFVPLALCPGVKLFSLQKGAGHEQLAPLTERLKIVDLGASLDEEGHTFVDTAAVMMNLDLVITSDTSMAHLAGALGVPVWVALQYSPNWRWLIDRSDSPWYPSMRLFRQSRFAEWSDVFERIAADLRTLSTMRA